MTFNQPCIRDVLTIDLENRCETNPSSMVCYFTTSACERIAAGITRPSAAAVLAFTVR